MREMAEQGGDDAVLPLVLLRLLEDSEARQKDAETQSERIGKIADAVGKLADTCQKTKSAQRETLTGLAGLSEKMGAVAPELIEELEKIVREAGNTQLEEFGKIAEQVQSAGDKRNAEAVKRLNAITSTLAEFKKAGKWFFVAVPIVLVIFALVSVG